MSSSTNLTIIDTILKHPFTYFTWYAKIKGSVPKDLWRYFDPEQQDELEHLEQVTISHVKENAVTLHELSAAEKSIFSQLRAIYNQDLTQYHRMLSQEAKLRERIMNSVSDSKKSQLLADKSPREWLNHLAESTKPTNSQMQEMIRSKYQVKMSVKHTE